MIFLRFLCILLALALPARGDTLRVAIFTSELDRKGPGLLLRDIRKGDPQADAVAQIVAHVAPDVLVLLRFDYDAGGLALGAFADLLATHGVIYPHRFALRPNAGLMTDHDLDGDGLLRGPRDAQGYGLYAGHNGMAVLSRLPLLAEAARDFSAMLWKDLPGAHLPEWNGVPFPSADALAVQRLSSTGHWDVPVQTPSGPPLHLLIYHATPPVFDGPEDRNGLRNADETRFWSLFLDGALPWPPPEAPVIVMGNANLDPMGGDGRGVHMRDLLAHPRLQDPAPRSAGAAASGFRAPSQSATDTVAWDADGEPGNLRVSYILPDHALQVTGAGVFWPTADDPEVMLLGDAGRGASRHRLVWMDIALPPPERGFLDASGGRG
jgi:hypothetical protein